MASDEKQTLADNGAAETNEEVSASSTERSDLGLSDKALEEASVRIQAPPPSHLIRRLGKIAVCSWVFALNIVLLLNSAITVYFEGRDGALDTIGILCGLEAAQTVSGFREIATLPHYEDVVTIFRGTQSAVERERQRQRSLSSVHGKVAETPRSVPSFWTSQLFQDYQNGDRLVWITAEVVDHQVKSYDRSPSVSTLSSPVNVTFHLLRPGSAEDSNRSGQQWSTYVNSVFDIELSNSKESQETELSADSKEVFELVLFEHSALLLVPGSQLATLDTRLHPHVRPYVLPFDLRRSYKPRTTLPALLRKALQRYLDLFAPAKTLAVEQGPLEPAKSNATFPPAQLDAQVSTLLRSPLLVDTKRILEDLEILSGEAKAASWATRHSATWGGLQAAKWILGEQRKAVEGRIPGARCDLWEYDRGHLSPNVVCIVPGCYERSTDVAEEGDKDYVKGSIVLSAHYDSRGSFGDPRAPGADDDGSGTALLLAVSRVLGETISAETSSDASGRNRQHHRRRRRRPLHLVFFSGEEQGLLGSQAYAHHLRNSISIPAASGASSPSSPHSPALSDVRLALQVDMIAYRRTGEPLSVAVPDKLSTVSASNFLLDTARLYAPRLVRGVTPVCCSDHQSFWEAGFPASWVFERPGPIADPKYHDSGDLVHREGYDVEQLKSIGRVVTAVAAQLLWE